MKRNNLTNQELLKELEKRLPDFNKDELMILSKLIMTGNPHKEEVLEFLKETHPKIHDLTQKAIQEAEQEKNEEEIEKMTETIKKALAKK
jgi:hypothetical protein